MNTQSIAQHLKIETSKILEVREWAYVLWVRFVGGCRFVSKKVNMNYNFRAGLKTQTATFTASDSRKAEKMLYDRFENELKCSNETLKSLCIEIVMRARWKMGEKYPVLGTPAWEKLYKKAIEIFYSLDESGELEKMAENQESDEISSNDMEDAITWIDCAGWVGTPKQIKWAKDIAHSYLNFLAIHLTTSKSSDLPTKASWWIENRNDIPAALAKN